MATQDDPTGDPKRLLGKMIHSQPQTLRRPPGRGFDDPSMTRRCDYCGNDLPDQGLCGRPWPGQPAAHYCCYGCLSLGEQQRQERHAARAAKSDALPSGLGWRLGIALLVIGQTMIFGLALNLHEDVPAAARVFVERLMLAATVAVMLLLGGPLARAAWQELRRGRLTIEALFVVTLIGAFAASLQAHLTGAGKIYWEVVSILLVVYTLGKLIGARARAAAVAGAAVWGDELTSCRRLDPQGREQTVPVDIIQPGDTVAVRPGEMIPVDGIIRRGIGLVSSAVISGEPFPTLRRPGDRVWAGSISHDALLVVEATTAGRQRQVDTLLQIVERARQHPISIQAQADRLGRWLVPLVILTAAATFAYWTVWDDGGWPTALFYSMSVLLVACPCVVGIAAPVIVWNALGRLAERSLIVRRGDAIERLAEVDHVFLDKTGTLTESELRLTNLKMSVRGRNRQRLLYWIAIVQQRCDHPFARAFDRIAPTDAMEPADGTIAALRVVPGGGVVAEIDATDGRHTLHIGSPQWIARVVNPTPYQPDAASTGGTAEPSPLEYAPDSAMPVSPARASEVRTHGVAIAWNGRLVATASLAEPYRDTAAAAVEELRQLGLTVSLATGDSTVPPGTLGITDVHAGVLPQDKVALVDQAKSQGRRPLVIGDGINDAAALARAHVGIALASGTDAAVVAADAVLYAADLRVIPWAVQLSRAAMRTLRRSLYWAVTYNIIGMTLAATGWLHPIVAVLLMTASSLYLIFLATRLSTFPDHCTPEPLFARLQRPVPEDEAASRRTRPHRSGSREDLAAAAHAVALGLQGITWLLLLEAARQPPYGWLIPAGFTAGGVVLAWIWHRWRHIPHALDMCWGMLTFGNLGMLLGWWWDNGCAALPAVYCEHCSFSLTQPWTLPGMWIGMLLLANAAMAWLGRRPSPGGHHGWAMFTGGNVGMVAGMVAGGMWATELLSIPHLAEPVIHFLGMTVGMLAGMLAGTYTVEAALKMLSRIGELFVWLQQRTVKRMDE